MEISWQDLLKNKIDANLGSLNICHEALDKHMGTETENKTAIKFIGKHFRAFFRFVFFIFLAMKGGGIALLLSYL